MKKILVFIIAIAASLSAQCQDLGMADFKKAYAKIRALKRYTYVSKTSAVFPNGQKDEMKTTSFIDIEKGNLAYKSDIEHVILNAKWFYKVNFNESFVSIFDVNKYRQKYPGAAGDLSAIFRSATALDHMDSLIAKHGKLVSARRSGDISVFEFSFPKEADLRSFVLKFDEKNGLPRSVQMRTENEDNYGRKMEMNILCEGYSRNVPDAEFDTSKYFTTNGTKATLLKYNKFKLTTIL